MQMVHLELVTQSHDLRSELNLITLDQLGYGLLPEIEHVCGDAQDKVWVES
jgi:hypothetical protein